MPICKWSTVIALYTTKKPWRELGPLGLCYRARLDGNQNLIDNHFGNAGGTMTIGQNDYEVEFNDCGIWEYQDS